MPHKEGSKIKWKWNNDVRQDANVQYQDFYVLYRAETGLSFNGCCRAKLLEAIKLIYIIRERVHIYICT
jgi:hypothetical protein